MSEAEKTGAQANEKIMKREQNTSLTGRVLKAGGWQIVKHLGKTVPFAGTAIALGLAGNSIRRKGFVKGAIDVGLDALPIIGTAKNVVEIFTGDLIADKESKDPNRSAGR